MKSFFFLLFLSAHLTACGQGAGIGFWAGGADCPDPDPDCLMYQLTNTSETLTASYNYADCCNEDKTGSVPPNTTVTICARAVWGEPVYLESNTITYCDGRPLPVPPVSVLFHLTGNPHAGYPNRWESYRIFGNPTTAQNSVRMRLFARNEDGSGEVLVEGYTSGVLWGSNYKVFYLPPDKSHMRIEFSGLALPPGLTWNGMSMSVRSYPNCVTQIGSAVTMLDGGYVGSVVLAIQDVCIWWQST
jgi:hypothetical protein